MISLCIANRNHISHIINRNNLILYIKIIKKKKIKYHKHHNHLLYYLHLVLPFLGDDFYLFEHFFC